MHSEKNNLPDIQTYTYELVDSKMYVIKHEGSALVFDPCCSREAIRDLDDAGVRRVDIILTHEHYDHISGIGMFREHFEGCRVVCTEKCGENIRSSLRNGSRYFAALLIDKAEEKLREAQEIEPVSYEADMTFEEELDFSWEGHGISITRTPGHSKGSCCILIDNRILFTGDSLIKDTKVITRLPGGNRNDYEEVTVPFFRSLAPDIYVYPGHGEGGTLGEMMEKNEIAR